MLGSNFHFQKKATHLFFDIIPVLLFSLVVPQTSRRYELPEANERMRFLLPGFHLEYEKGSNLCRRSAKNQVRSHCFCDLTSSMLRYAVESSDVLWWPSLYVMASMRTGLLSRKQYSRAFVVALYTAKVSLPVRKSVLLIRKCGSVSERILLFRYCF